MLAYRLRQAMVTAAAMLPTAVTAQGMKEDALLKRDIEQVRAAAVAAERQDCATVVKLTVPLVDRTPPRLPPAVLAPVYHMTAFCEIFRGDTTASYRHALAGSALTESSDELWRLRLGLELDAKNYAAAVTTAEAMTQGHGAALNGVRTATFYQFDNALRDAGDTALRQRLLAVLTRSYSPDAPTDTVDGFRQRHAGLLVDAGDQAGARATIADITHASTLLNVSFDPRLRTLLPTGFDIRALVERNLVEARTLTARHPDLIAPVLLTAIYLRVLGRPAESLAALDTIKDGMATPGAFADADEQTIWWWDERARAYGMLGRHDDEIAALRQGAEKTENGGLNVSQVINLSQAQVDAGRPADALQTLAAFDGAARSVSPFGQMQIRFTRACALGLLGHAAEASADIAYVREHEKDAPRTVTELMLCLGNLDGAAASFLRRLGDPDQRVDALLQLSDYDTPPVPAAKPEPLLVHLPAVKARGDVTAAIARAGGTRRIPLQRVQF